MIDSKESPFVFVVMPFAPSFTSVYQRIIKPAVETCGIDCVRADEDSQGHIHGQMLQRIYESTVVIADISGLNANVFYELGVAHSIGCKTIVICNSDNLDNIPFDIAPYRVFAYPHPDKETEGSVKEAVQALGAGIMSIINDQSEGVPNPVQDYLASQSPIRSANSLFVSEFGAQSEEDLLVTATREIVYYGITGNSFSDLLTGLIESRPSTAQLEVQLCLLDPEAHDCWDFMYQMREGTPINSSISKENQEEDVIIQRRAVRRLESAASRIAGISIKVNYFSVPPLFWAYLVDQERLIVGHLAMRRLSARNLPVNILVRGDRTTQNLFTYYHNIIESSLGNRNAK